MISVLQNIRLIPEEEDGLTEEEYAVGFKKGNTELCDKVNADLKKLAEDGTVEKLAEKYEIADMVTLK